MSDELQWILGSLGSIAIIGLSVWWKVESRQDQKIDNLAEQNHKAHTHLYSRIDGVEEKMTEQHVTLLSKFEEVWKHRADK